MADRPQKVEVGFSGGQVIAARVTPGELADLRKALDGAGGWHELQSEDGQIAVDLRQVVFVRIVGGEHSIGFSGE